MAENVVSFLLKKLDELLGKWDLVQSVDIKILSLRNKLELMQAFLRDVDARRRDDERIKVWVNQVRQVAFRAEDAIDRYLYEVQYRRQSGFAGSMRNLVNRTRRLNIRYQLGIEIEEIKQMLQEISASRSEFGIELQKSGGDVLSSGYSIAPWQQNRALVEETDDVIGFDHHIKTLADRLTDERQGDVVVSIVGMGGLGKTTLARSVYNHADVNRHFDCQAWVYVSQKYRRRELLKSILEELLKPKKEKLKWKKEDETEKLDKDKLEKMTEKEMENEIKSYLQGKKYLLVIDDIWEEEAWNYIRRALPHEKNARRILLTTRNEDVAKCVDPTGPPYKIENLDETNSWKLLCSKVFEAGAQADEELKDIGMKMVRRCAGLPLAITVLGGLLSRKPKLDVEWRKVLNRITHVLHERDDGQNVRRILALSYDDLPHYLRSCFLYLGLFPEDSKIEVEKLIQLWVAEGFIQARGEQTMEEAAEDYVEELVDRCMIQVVKWNSWGGVDSCRVHDLLLDLSITQGKEERFLSILAGNPPANNAHLAASPRRAAIHRGSISESVPTHRSSPSSLRSLLCFSPEARLYQVHLVVNNLKLLRVLDLKGAKIQRLPKRIGGMVHLRYLGLELELGEEGIIKLPSSVGRLRNLQTLRVGACLVPDSVWKIETLRHITGEVLIKCRTIHSSCKGDLQTLWGITAGSWVGGVLGDFTNLRALFIQNIFATHVSGLSESLKKLTQLNKLTLHFVGAQTMVETVSAAVANHTTLYELVFTEDKTEKFLNAPLLCIAALIYACVAYPNLLCTSFPSIASSYIVERGSREWQPPQFHLNVQFPASLTRLKLGITVFSKQEELASLQSLPNLKILILDENAYIGKDMIFKADGFIKLQELQLCELKELEKLTIHDGAMPYLKRFTINKCHMLKSLPDGLQSITTLQQFELKSMPKAFTDRIQKEEGEDWYKVHHIPSITVE